MFSSHSFIASADQSNFIRGFGQGHGFAQVIALIAIEVVTAVSECGSTNGPVSYNIMKFPPGLYFWHPYYSKGYNIVNYLLQTTKVISHVLLLLFVPSINFNVSCAEACYSASIDVVVAHGNHYRRHCPPRAAFGHCDSLGCVNHPQDGYEPVLVSF